MKLTEAQKKALAWLADPRAQEWEPTWHLARSSATPAALEARGLVESRPRTSIGLDWEWRITDKGREALQ